MSAYNESVRQIFIDVQTFLNETLKNEKLSNKSKNEKNKIAESIQSLQDEYPALKKSRADDESVFTSSSATSEEDHYEENKILDVSVADLKSYLKTGYLDKRGKGILGRSYQKRYCICEAAVLYYFEKPTDKKQKGAFHLNGYEFRPAPNQIKDAAKKELCFELVAPGKRTYEFVAENKDEFKSWKETVEDCHNEPIDEEIYEFIEEKPGRPKKEEYSDEETYEEPCSEIATPPKLPDTRKLSTISTKPAPPPVPSTPIPDAAPVPPSLPRRDLPAVPKVPLPAIPKDTGKVAKLDIPDRDPDEDYENMYYGKWNCPSEAENELEFKKGDIIHVLSKDFDQERWWVGALKGSVGLVPKEYLAKAYQLIQ